MLAFFGAVSVAVSLSGCATPPPEDDPEAVAAFKEANDPLEPFNRAVFDFNLAVDKAVFRPAAFLWINGVPENIRNMLSNFLDNLLTPVTLAHDLLQGEFDRAGTTLLRFGINSSIGALGVADPASEMGFVKHLEDAGQTLGVYGVDEGPFLMLPILGPSNPRDGIGLAIDIVIDPFFWIGNTNVNIARLAGTALDTRARRFDTINELERTSLDFYATVRSLYRQRRADEIRNGAPAPDQPLPDISFEEDGGAQTIGKAQENGSK